MEKIDFDLNGKVGLITGAGVGIEKAIALCLARYGTRIGIHYRSSQKEAEQVLNEIKNIGSDGILIQADLVNEKQANSIVDSIVSKLRRFDILVNNTGSLVKRSKIEECPLNCGKKCL